jgi:hypothetical protein
VAARVILHHFCLAFIRQEELAALQDMAEEELAGMEAQGQRAVFMAAEVVAVMELAVVARLVQQALLFLNIDGAVNDHTKLFND